MPKKEAIELNKQLRQCMQITGKGKNWRVVGSNGVVRYGPTSKNSCQEWLDSNYPVQ